MGAAAREANALGSLIAFSTPLQASPWKRWLLYSPLARIAIFAVVAACLAFLAQLAFIWLGWSAKRRPCTAIAIEAGLLPGLVYHVFRSLPLCIRVHLGWNFAQGTVYGIPVSGAPIEGWRVSTRIGPDPSNTSLGAG